MANELIITSVRKGLDGGSGYQPVLRTRGMKPAVAERLQIRCGYAHPYAHGNSRNPIVFVHRLERVGGERLHVLGRICDAGSDHTGRSNFLAHLVAVSEPETRRMAAGPADTAKRFTFKSSWNETARESEPPTLIAADLGPAPCAAWRTAGLDPGIAGDLAEAAMAGGEVRLIVRERDDVLALFADALALVPPAKRWQVTFNTCEIEPFDATWRAVREDLPQAKAVRGTTGVIDLTVPNARGSDGAYARFARGDAATLPWQAAAEQATALPVAPATSQTSRKTSDTSKSPPVRQPGNQAGFARPAPTPPSPQTGKRNLLERVAAADATHEVPSDARPQHLRTILLWSAAAIVTIAALSLLAVPILWPDAVASIATMFRSKDAGQDALAAEQAKDAREKAEEERRRSTAEAERAAKEAAAQEAEVQRQKQAAEKLAAAELAAAKAAEEEQRRKQILADEERKKKEAQNQTEAAQQKRLEAFKQFENLPTEIPEDLPRRDSDSPGNVVVKPIRIGPLDPSHLEGFTVALAVPRELSAQIVPVADKANQWKIVAHRSAVEDASPKPIDLATISAESGELRIEPAKDVLSSRQFRLMRRSVLLVSAVDPSKPDDRPMTRSIQLLRPAPTPPALPVPLGKTGTGSLIVSDRRHKASELLADDVDVEYTIEFGFEKDGTEKPLKHDLRLSSHGVSGTHYCPLLQRMVPPDPGTTIGVKITLSLPDATMRIEPQADGPNAMRVNFKELIDQAKKTDEEVENEKNALIAKTKTMVDKLRKSTPDHFEKDSQRTLDALFELQRLNDFAVYKANFGEFFAETGSITEFIAADPSKPNEKKKQVVANPDRCVQIWNERCESIVRSGPRAVDEWKTEFVDRVTNWFAFWEPRFKEHADQFRKYCKPFEDAHPVRITVSRITSKAFAHDGTEYPVLLAKRVEQKSDKRSRTNPDFTDDTQKRKLD